MTNKTYEHSNRKRLKMGIIIIMVLFLALVFRLYYIQVYRSEGLTSEARLQRGRQISTYPKRGLIYDRNLVPITNNRSEYNLLIEKERLADGETFQAVKKASGLSSRELEKKIDSKNSLLQIPIIDRSPIANLKDIFIVDIVKRYDRANPLAHVVGYISKSDNIGRSGIEKVYDEFLFTRDMESFLVEYDRDRKIVLGGSKHISPASTSNDPTAVQLTIDIRLQKEVERVMDEARIKGAVIVNEVESGDILAMASRPNFNQDRIEDYLTRNDQAFYNKAIGISYPPGSIFKIVVLLAALEDNIDIVNEKFYCPGYEMVNNRPVNCTRSHGQLDLKDDFAKSCNSSFIQLGKRLGPEKIIKMARKLGLASKIDIGLLEEVGGKLPGEREATIRDIGNISIGQGNIELTALQVSNMVNIIASGGIEKDLAIVKAISNKDGMPIKAYRKNPSKRVIDKEISDIVLDYMKAVVATGTAKTLNLDYYGGAGGKTGTAEAVYNERTTVHGWFTGFFPSENPNYVITIIVENASLGATRNLPIFEKIAKEIHKLYL